MKVNHDQLLSLEQPLIKVPAEQLKKSFRNQQKLLEKELSSITTRLQDIENNSGFEEIISRVQLLQAKLIQLRKQEQQLLDNTGKRLKYLKNLQGVKEVESEEFESWAKSRLNQLLCDYLARQGYNDTAQKLATQTNVYDFLDLDVYRVSQRIQESMMKYSCTDALQWCAENKTAMKKLNSDLEFQLRLQEYIELVRVRNINAAIVYLKKYLTPWSGTHLKELQQVMILDRPPGCWHLNPQHSVFSISNYLIPSDGIIC